MPYLLNNEEKIKVKVREDVRESRSLMFSASLEVAVVEWIMRECNLRRDVICRRISSRVKPINCKEEKRKDRHDNEMMETRSKTIYSEV